MVELLPLTPEHHAAKECSTPVLMDTSGGRQGLRWRVVLATTLKTLRARGVTGSLTAPLAGDDERQHEAHGPAGSGHTQLPAILRLLEQSRPQTGINAHTPSWRHGQRSP